MKLNYYGNLAGGNKPMLSQVELAVNEDIKCGTVLYYDETKRGAVTTATDTVIGVAAENYSAEPDELNPASSKGIVKAIVSPDAMYSVRGEVFKYFAGDSSSSSIYIPFSTQVNSILAGGSRFKFKLVKKQPDSVTSINQGEYFVPGSMTCSNGNVIINSSNITVIDERDEFLFIPAVGFDCITIGEDGSATVDIGKEGNAVVVAVDEANGNYIVKLKNHIFA